MIREKPRFTRQDVEALIEALVAAEKYKPFQVAKRIVFEKRGLLGTRKDKILTAIIYSFYRLQGMLDKAVAYALGGLPQDYWRDILLRQLLRLSAYLAQFDKVKDPSLEVAFKKYGVRQVAYRLGWRRARLAYKVFEKLRKNPWRPATSLEELEYKYLVPQIIIDSLRKFLSSREIESLLSAMNSMNHYSIRVNTLKATPEEVLEYLHRHGIKAWRSKRVPTVILYEGGFNEPIKKLVEEGLAIPQDEASAYASILLKPSQGEKIVDLCAAPGGKTTHLAELSENRAHIIAIDVFHDRMARLIELARRTETIVSIEPVVTDGLYAPYILGEEFADKVLVDPPCSSTGALSKHPDARWRLTKGNLDELVFVQRGLLVAGFRLLKPGGLLLYTTCSLLVEENEDNIRWFLGEYQGRAEIIPLQTPYEESKILKGAMRAWPHKHKTIGFYYTLIRKKK